MNVAAATGSARDRASLRRSRRAGTAAHPLNIASRIPRHRTSPPAAPPAIPAASWEPKTADPPRLQKAHQSRGKHTGNGQHRMGPWILPSKLLNKNKCIIF